MDRKTEFIRDMMQAFSDLPADRFAKFRAMAAELGVPIEVLCMTVIKWYMREKRRRRREE